LGNYAKLWDIIQLKCMQHSLYIPKPTKYYINKHLISFWANKISHQLESRTVLL